MKSGSGPGFRGWIFDLITMLAVVVGLIYGAIELREFRQDQELQAILELQRTFQAPEHIRALHWVLYELPENLPPEELPSSLSPEESRLRLQTELAWESLGIMVFRGDVAIEWVDEFYRYPILTSWRKLEPHVRYQREQAGYEGIGEWFQWLAERLEERPGRGAGGPAYEAHREWSG